MHESINVLFWGGMLPDPADHPAGEPVMELMRTGVAASGWTCSGLDHWRDSGWQFSCEKDGQSFDCVLAYTATERSEAVVQIAPRSRGRAAPAAATLELAEVFSALLRRVDAQQRWIWNGYPEDHDAQSPHSAGHSE